MHENNIPRLIRALEVYHATGIPLSVHIARSKAGGSPYHPFWLGLGYRDRSVLYDRINRRVDQMLESGLLEEARAAYDTRMKTAAQAIGCKELFPSRGKRACRDVSRPLSGQRDAMPNGS